MIQGQTVFQVWMDLTDHQEHQEHLASPDWPEQLVCKDKWEKEETMECPKSSWENPENLVKWDHLDHQAHQDHQAHADQQAHQDHQDHQDPMENQDQTDHQDHQEQLEPLEKMEAFALLSAVLMAALHTKTDL